MRLAWLALFGALACSGQDTRTESPDAMANHPDTSTTVNHPAAVPSINHPSDGGINHPGDSAGPPPTPTLALPLAGTVAQGANIDLRASFADSESRITKVEYYRGVTLVGTATSKPWRVQDDTSALTFGNSYSYTAKAYADTQTSTSAAVSVTIGWSPITIAAPYAWYEAASQPYTQVGRWGDDSGNGRDMYATSSGSAVAYSAPYMNSPDTTKTLVSIGAASTWRLLHDGTGVTFAIVGRMTAGGGATQGVFATGTLAAVGIYVSADAVNGRLVVQIRNVTNGSIYSYAGTAASVPNGTQFCLTVKYATADATDVSISLSTNGGAPSVVSSGNVSFTPDAGDPTGTLHLWSLGGGTSPFKGDIAKVAIWNSSLTAQNITDIHTYFPTSLTRRQPRKLWCVGESTTAAASPWDRFMDRSLKDGKWVFSSVGSAPVWVRYTLGLTANSGYAGHDFSQLATDLTTDTVSASSGVTDVLLNAGINEAVHNDLTSPPILAGSVTRLNSLMVTIEGRTPGAKRYLVSPNLSTDAGTEAKLVLLRAQMVTLASTRGWKYIDLMAGTYPIEAADITGDGIHPTTSTAPSPPNARAGYDDMGDTYADNFDPAIAAP